MNAMEPVIIFTHSTQRQGSRYDVRSWHGRCSHTMRTMRGIVIRGGVRELSLSARPAREWAKSRRIRENRSHNNNIIVLTSFYSVLGIHNGVATAPNYRRRICEFSHFRLLVLVHREDAHSHMGKKGNTSVKTQVSSIVWTNKHRGSIPRFPTEIRLRHLLDSDERTEFPWSHTSGSSNGKTT